MTASVDEQEEWTRHEPISALWEALGRGETSDQSYFAVQAVAEVVVKKYRAHVRELGWTEMPALELTHEFFSKKPIADTLAALVEKATSERSFAALLYVAVKNYFFDLHRKSPCGKIAKRLEEQLRQIGAVNSVADSWALPTTRAGPWDGDEDALSQVAAGFQYEPIEYASETRSSPTISNESLRELLKLVLETAGGPVPLTSLLGVVAQRTTLGSTPTFVEMDDSVYHGSTTWNSPEERAIARAVAARFHDQLSDDLILAFTHQDLTVREMASAMGVSTSKAQSLRKKLREMCEPFRTGAEDPRSLLLLDEMIEEKLRQT